MNRDLDIIGQMQGSSYNETNSRLLSITTGSGGTDVYKRQRSLPSVL